MSLLRSLQFACPKSDQFETGAESGSTNFTSSISNKARSLPTSIRPVTVEPLTVTTSSPAAFSRSINAADGLASDRRIEALPS